MLKKKTSLVMFAVVISVLTLAVVGCGDSESDKGPEGSSCSNAIPITLSTPGSAITGGALTGTSAAIESPGNADYFSLAVTEGQFLYIATNSNPPDPEVLPMLDPVISLYGDDEETLLATGDDQIPRINVDSEIFYRAGFTGDLCIKVEDGTSWRDDTPAGDPAWTYEIVAARVSDIGGVVVDEGDNDSTNTAQNMLVVGQGAGQTEWGLACGMLENSDDEDYYALPLPSGRNNLAIFSLNPGTGSGGSNYSQGHGSTLDAYIFEQLDSNGDVFATIDMDDGLGVIEAPATANADVYIRVRAAASMTTGDNDFYCLRFIVGPANATTETETEGATDNDNMDDAEIVSFTDGAVRVQGSIDSATDKDYYKFTASSGDVYRLLCWSATNGSGLEGATFAIHGPDDSVLQTETEVVPNSVYWAEAEYNSSKPQVIVNEDGTHYFVVSGQGQNPDVLGSYYSCFLYQN